jgi:hypothetical protein
MAERVYSFGLNRAVMRQRTRLAVVMSAGRADAQAFITALKWISLGETHDEVDIISSSAAARIGEPSRLLA